MRCRRLIDLGEEGIGPQLDVEILTVDLHRRCSLDLGGRGLLTDPVLELAVGDALLDVGCARLVGEISELIVGQTGPVLLG